MQSPDTPIIAAGNNIVSSHISLDDVVSYLQSRGYSLAALELYMELMEDEIQSPKLTEYIEQTVGSELKSEKPKVQAKAFLHGESADIMIREKDEQIAKLEYRLRLANEDLESMKERVEKATKQVMAAAPSLPKHKDGDHSASGQSKILEAERRVVNVLVKQYLLSVGYKLSAITLADEVTDQDLDDLEDVGLAASNVTLIALYRHLFNQVSLKKDQDVEIELAVALSEKKRLEGAVSQLQKELSTQQKVSKREVRKLHTLLEKGGIAEGAAGTSVEETSERDRGSVRMSTGSMNVETALLLEKTKDQLNETIGIVSDALPKIKDGLLLKHRDVLIPVTLQMVQLHSEALVRDQLTNQLFNLIKRPDSTQRKMIVDGFVRLAGAVGEERTGSELLPQCWEQVSDKHEERRILVADSCGSLVRFVSPDLRRSLILSILTSLSEDKSEQVRAATARNICHVLAVLADGDKSPTIFEMSLRLLQDPSPLVTDIVKSKLIASVIRWASKTDLFFSTLIPKILKSIEKYVSSECNTLERDKTISAEYDRALATHPPPQKILDSKAISLLTHLCDFLPAMKISIFLSCPALSTKSKKILKLFLDDFGNSEEGKIDFEKFARKTDKFIFEKIKSSVCVSENWAGISWLLEIFLPSLSLSATKCHPSATDLYNSIFILFSKIAVIFGPTITLGVCLPPMENIIMKGVPPVSDGEPLPTRITSADVSPSAETSGDTAASGEIFFVRLGSFSNWHLDDKNIDAVHRRCRLIGPVVMGLLGALAPRSPLPFTSLSSTIIENIALTKKGWGSIPIDCLSLGAVHLCKLQTQRDTFVVSVTDAISSGETSPEISSVYISLLHRIVPFVGGLLMAKKVLPVLTTIALSAAAEDSNIQIQQLAIAALGEVLCLEWSDVSIIDKAKDVLDKVSDLVRVPSAILQLTHTFGRLVSLVKAPTRDTFILPHLTLIAARNNHETDRITRTQLSAALLAALLKFFDPNTFGFAFNQTVEVIVTHLLPTVRLLIIDADAGIFDGENSGTLQRLEGEILRSLPEEVRAKNLHSLHPHAAAGTHLNLPGAMKSLFSFDTKNPTHAPPPPAATPPTTQGKSAERSEKRDLTASAEKAKGMFGMMGFKRPGGDVAAAINDAATHTVDTNPEK